MYVSLSLVAILSLLAENINQVDMKKLLQRVSLFFFSVAILTCSSCRDNSKAPSTETLNAINLKKGELVLCSPPDKQFVGIGFETSCSEKSKTDFNLAIALCIHLNMMKQKKFLQKLLMKNPIVRWLIGEWPCVIIISFGRTAFTDGT